MIAGLSATAKAAAWANSLEGPLTKESKVYLGLSVFSLVDAAGVGVVACVTVEMVGVSGVVGCSGSGVLVSRCWAAGGCPSMRG